MIDKRHTESRFAGMIEQFHTEIQALRSLHHPNIITLYDVYITDEKIFIVMELMEGGELFDYVVQKGTLNEEEASKIVRKVTSALVYMHSKNIIHRDLKPENLLLTHKPRSSHDIEVKIIDFGLSKVSLFLCWFVFGFFWGVDRRPLPSSRSSSLSQLGIPKLARILSRNHPPSLDSAGVMKRRFVTKVHGGARRPILPRNSRLPRPRDAPAARLLPLRRRLGPGCHCLRPSLRLPTL